MTSLIESSPATIATNLSSPIANPPWGGANFKASKKKPNFSFASLSEIFNALKTLLCKLLLLSLF